MNSFKGGMDKTVNQKSFWRHCIGCGLIAREIAILTEIKIPERYYIAGMLYDIGSLVIFSKLPESSMEAVKL
jgi:HD-like signal output (HDOD) protein|tara:strand:+ start:167 stop:382 length:216 start_codon:yes stop_codon:yes gene_type:complete